MTAAAAPLAAPGTLRLRPLVLGTLAGLLITGTAALLVPIGLLTCFRARRLYAYVAASCCRAILWMYGIRVVVRMHPASAALPQAAPIAPVVYISNHTSTLDLFVLVSLGLPRCRFFLSGFLRKAVPLGYIAWLMGTFFTVPQDRPAERVRIFQRAERVLRRTGESVYLSPEGGRITSGRIGHFNKGAFHLATNLKMPIVPLYFRIPRDVDPGRGYNARPGVVEIDVLPPIDTASWRLEDLDANRAHVRDLFVRLHEGARC